MQRPVLLKGSPSDEITDLAAGRDAVARAVPRRRRGGPHGAGGDEIGKSICRRVDSCEASNGTSPIGHYDHLALADPFEVSAQVVLEIADTHGCSYIHDLIVAT